MIIRAKSFKREVGELEWEGMHEAHSRNQQFLIGIFSLWIWHASADLCIVTISYRACVILLQKNRMTHFSSYNHR